MTLTLPVNKFFFNQVSNKELETDFRAIKPYWINKLIKNEYKKLIIEDPYQIIDLYSKFGYNLFKDFEHVIFKNGYSNNSPSIKTKFELISLTNPNEPTCMGYGIFFAIKISYI